MPSKHHFIFRLQLGTRWVLAEHLTNATIEEEQQAYARIVARHGMSRRQHQIKRITTDLADKDAAWSQLLELEESNEQ